jgi:hypothetical protein
LNLTAKNAEIASGISWFFVVLGVLGELGGLIC